MSVLKYSSHKDEHISDVKDLLALGEEIEPEVGTIIKKKKKVQEQSDSEVEDWEEVNGKVMKIAYSIVSKQIVFFAQYLMGI